MGVLDGDGPAGCGERLFRCTGVEAGAMTLPACLLGIFLLRVFLLGVGMDSG